MKEIKHPSNNFSGVKGRRGRKGQKGEKGDAGTNVQTYCSVKCRSFVSLHDYIQQQHCMRLSACEVPA